MLYRPWPRSTRARSTAIGIVSTRRRPDLPVARTGSRIWPRAIVPGSIGREDWPSAKNALSWYGLNFGWTTMSASLHPDRSTSQDATHPARRRAWVVVIRGVSGQLRIVVPRCRACGEHADLSAAGN